VASFINGVSWGPIYLIFITFNFNKNVSYVCIHKNNSAHLGILTSTTVSRQITSFINYVKARGQ